MLKDKLVSVKVCTVAENKVDIQKLEIAIPISIPDWSQDK